MEERPGVGGVHADIFLPECGPGVGGHWKLLDHGKCPELVGEE